MAFFDAQTAAKLEDGSTVIPQERIDTIPLSDFVSLSAMLSPEEEQPSWKVQQGHMLVVHGETSEEELARRGFSLKVDG